MSPTQLTTENARAVEILRQAGVLAELTPAERVLAAEWRALSTERQQEVLDALDHARFQPTLSETVMQERG